MRIAYLINGLNGGGAAFPMLQVIGLMRDLGHDVRVLAMMPQDGKAAARLQRAGIPFEVLGRGPGDIVAPAWRLVRQLRSWRPGLLWTSLTRATLYGQMAGRLLGIPVISWQHSDWLKPANLALLRRTRGLTGRWVADSDAVAAFVQSALGVAPRKIEVWPPFVADPCSPVSRAWDGAGPLRLGSLGRLHTSKQYAVLLKAFALARRLDPALGARLELHLAGDGPEQQMLGALAADMRLAGSVHFIGFVEQPAAFLASLHGYLQTSLKEGFCIAVHEAMQAGLPVITTRVGEPARSVRPGQTGWLCDVGDVDALALAMLDLARDPAAAARMGRTGREFVLDRFSEARFRARGELLLADFDGRQAAMPDTSSRSAAPR